MDEERYTVERYEILSFSTAAPGWRAQLMALKGSSGYRVVPLIGWGVYELTITDTASGETFKHRRRLLGGVYLSGTTPTFALEDGDFSNYLSPDQPNPDPKDQGNGENPKTPGYDPEPV